MPDFILGGAMKAGTTTVWSWLARHPDVGMPEGKEPRFFTEERGLADGGEPDAPLRSGRYREGLAWYESLFSACAGKAVLGEASSRYLHAPDAARLIRAALPQVKLVFVLRDPVERMHAHYRQELRTLSGLPEFPDIVRSRHPRFARYLADSAYATLLERYLPLFDRERILLLLTDELRRDPAAAAARLFAFLGVDPAPARDLPRDARNPSAGSRSRRLNRWLTLHPLGPLKERLPRGLARAASRVRRSLVELNTVRRSAEPLPRPLRLELIGLLREEIERTERIVGRDLSSWRAA